MTAIIALTLSTFVSMYLSGLLARRRGRRVKVWLWLAALLGPIALLIILLLPTLQKQAVA
jgi:hypothetical protein